MPGRKEMILAKLCEINDNTRFSAGDLDPNIASVNKVLATAQCVDQPSLQDRINSTYRRKFDPKIVGTGLCRGPTPCTARALCPIYQEKKNG